MGRRGFLAAAACGALAACRARKTDATTLRLGHFPNLTHAPALTLTSSGRLARALGATRLDAKVFNAGPAAIGALLAGALDACYVGPIPAASGFLRTQGRALKVISGAASGGVLFVVRAAANIRGPDDLRGKRVASPQLGNTQDIALRRYLSDHGLASTDRGGDVTVTCLENPNILSLFRQGSLDGAWVPEPWASRLLAENGQILVDERDLWPDRAFAITLLVARADFLRDAPAVVDRLLDAHAAEVRRLREHPDEGRDEVGRALVAMGASALPPAVMASAWSRLAFTADPLRDSVVSTVQHAQQLGFLPAGSLANFFDDARVARALAASR